MRENRRKVTKEIRCENGSQAVVKVVKNALVL